MSINHSLLCNFISLKPLTSKIKLKTMSLLNAPQHIQLAVDLIQLLEENQVDNEVVLKALEIVKQDYLHKQAASNKEQ